MAAACEKTSLQGPLEIPSRRSFKVVRTHQPRSHRSSFAVSLPPLRVGSAAIQARQIHSHYLAGAWCRALDLIFSPVL